MKHKGKEENQEEKSEKLQESFWHLDLYRMIN